MVPVPHQLLGKPAPMNGFRIATVIMAGCKLEMSIGLFVGNTRIHLHLQIVHQVGEFLIKLTIIGITFCAAANFTGISAVLELLFQVC